MVKTYAAEEATQKRDLAKAATRPLALALHYVTAASAQFDLVIIEGKAKFEEKDFWRGLQKKLATVNQSVILRIKTPEAREQIRNEHVDEFRIDAFLHQLMQLNEDGWAKAEEMLGKILNGQEP